MISTFFLTILYGFVSLITNFLPTGNLPSEISTAIDYLWAIGNSFSYVIPIDTLLQALLLVLAFDLALLLWHFINWIIRKIPGMQ